MELPKDPVMLLSFVNLKLRDYYSSLDDMCDGLDALCEDMQTEKQKIIDTLKGIDYEYDESRHQFV